MACKRSMTVMRYKRVPLVAQAVIYLLGVILIGAMALWIAGCSHPAPLTWHDRRTDIDGRQRRAHSARRVRSRGWRGGHAVVHRPQLRTQPGRSCDRPVHKAVGQLGDDSSPVRVGGVYALERIGHDSAKDRTTIIYVLGAFIRERSRVPDREERPPEDLLAGIRVAGRLLQRSDVQLDLTEANLRNTDLSHLPSQQVILQGAVLEGAQLPQ